MMIKIIKHYRKNLVQSLLLISLTVPGVSSAADDGPRMYWNGPVDFNVLQLYTMYIQGNSISSNNQIYNPDLDVDMELMILEYDRFYDLAGDTFLFTAMLSAGHIAAEELNQYKQSSNGFGDLYIQGVYNIYGAPALSMEEFADYKQDTMVSLLLGVSLPTGSYDGDRLLNMGQNRWGLRTGVSFVQSLGEWIPGEITTLEILPSAWFYTDNDDFIGNTELSQDTLYMLEAHLTRDITTRTYVSLDYALQSGGETSINGVKQDDDMSVDSLGVSLGYMLNEQSMLTLRYSSALNPDPDKELDVDIYQININYMW